MAPRIERALGLTIAGILLTAFFAGSCPSSAAAAERPHIVLVMADDQGWGDMAYAGDPVLQTPNFDAAAASGLRFDRFYAAAPVCSPTRASVMTGRTPNRMGVFQWGYPMRPQETTLAEALKVNAVINTLGAATSNNKFGNQGVILIAIADALKVNTVLNLLVPRPRRQQRTRSVTRAQSRSRYAEAVKFKTPR